VRFSSRGFARRAIGIDVKPLPVAGHFGNILRDSQPSHLVVHADLLQRIRGALTADVRVLVIETPPEICDAYGISGALATPASDGVAWSGWLQGWAPWAGTTKALRGSMVYTSGTTGRPKAVRREAVRAEHRDEYARLRAAWFGHRAGMRTAIVGPLYHSVQAT
jgi:long-chain acyl-CoA synthetase